MNVVLDNNALVYLLNPRASRNVKARLRGLLSKVEVSDGQVLIPTPVLTEYLCHAVEQQLRQTLMTRFRTSRWVEVVPYDEPAAIEAADMHIKATTGGDKRTPLAETTAWQSVKIDRQIVAIAKVRRASIVTGDDDVLKVAKWAGVEAMKAQELPIPESERQMLIEGVARPTPPGSQVLPTIAPKQPTESPPAAEAGAEPSA